MASYWSWIETELTSKLDEHKIIYEDFEIENTDKELLRRTIRIIIHKVMYVIDFTPKALHIRVGDRAKQTIAYDDITVYEIGADAVNFKCYITDDKGFTMGFSFPLPYPNAEVKIACLCDTLYALGYEDLGIGPWAKTISTPYPADLHGNGFVQDMEKRAETLREELYSVAQSVANLRDTVHFFNTEMKRGKL